MIEVDGDAYDEDDGDNDSGGDGVREGDGGSEALSLRLCTVTCPFGPLALWPFGPLSLCHLMNV